MLINCVLLFLIVLIAALVFEIWREVHHFKVTHYHVASKKLAGLQGEVKLLFLSDLHNCVYGKGNSRLLAAIRRENPDLILIGGDMLVGAEHADADPALAFVRRLPEICPVYYVKGNHEQRMEEAPEEYSASFEAYKKELVESGVCFVENSFRRIRLRGKLFTVYGLELPASTYKKFRKAAVTAEEIGRYLGRPGETGRKDGEEAYTVLLAHNPAYMDSYLEWGADLVLSGHLHGGLIRIPLLGGIVTPQGFLFPKYSGEMTREGERTVIVSRGLGSHTVNIRLFNTPEIVAVHLSGEDKGRG